jgi:hypothetical protein
MDNRELLQEITQLINSSAKETREYVDTSVLASARETREYVDATARETRNHFDAVVESLEHPIRMIADGHMILAEKADDLAVRMERVEGRVDRLGTEAEALRFVVQAGDAALREELVSFRAEVRGEFAELRRVARVESAVSELSARVGRLEKRAGA